MHIAGFVKQSFIDYPGNIASVVFTAGCNLRCPFCHNPQLVIPEQFPEKITENFVLDYLRKNAKLLDALVITGGEPLMNPDLHKFLAEIKTIPLLIKLDTNGSFPERLNDILEKKMVDHIAMDIKHSLVFEKYRDATGHLTSEVFEKIKQSVSFIKKSNVDHEFRTTIAKGLHSIEDLIAIGKSLSDHKWLIQQFRKENTLNPEMPIFPYSEVEMKDILVILKANNFNVSSS